MSISIHFLVFVCLFVFSYLVTGVMKKLAIHMNAVDIPNQRSSHTIVTPRGGGVAIVIGIVGSTLLGWYQGLVSYNFMVVTVFGGGSISIISFLDDLYCLSAKIRFFVHTMTVIFCLWWSYDEVFSIIMGNLESYNIILAVSVVGVVWCINLYNFMDGIDGFAAIEFISIGLCLALIEFFLGGLGQLTLIATAVVSVGLGFLMWNWSPAQIFMGDVGSCFIGFLLPMWSLSLVENSNVSLWSWLILGGAFIIDASCTLSRRILNGEKWYAAHRSHFYQRLALHMNSHKKVSIYLLLVNLLWLGPWACLASVLPHYGLIITFLAFIPMISIVYGWPPISRVGMISQHNLNQKCLVQE